MPRTLSLLSDQQRQRGTVGWLQLLTMTLPHPTRAPLTIRTSDGTRYLPRQIALDLFDRADGSDLGPDWAPTGAAGFNALQLVSQAVRSAATGGTDSLELYRPTLPTGLTLGETLGLAETLVADPPAGGRVGMAEGLTLAEQLALAATFQGPFRADVYAALDVAALGSGGGRVGAWLRARGAPVRGYVCAVTPTTATILRYASGISSTLGTVAATWAPGDVVWAEIDGATLRIRKRGVLLLEVTDPTPFLFGDVGLSIFCPGGQPLSDYAIGAARFGNLREEYLPLILDVGDIGDSFEASNVASAPSSALPMLSNIVPIAAGGVRADRLGDLFRAGANAAGYDLAGGKLQIEWLPPGGAVGADSVVLYQGRVEAPDDLDDVTLRLPSTSREGSVRIAIEDAVVAGDNALLPITNAYVEDGSNLRNQYFELIFPEWTPAFPTLRTKFGCFTPTAPANGFCSGPPSFLFDFAAAALLAGTVGITVNVDYQVWRQGAASNPGYPLGTMKLLVRERIYGGFYRNLLDVPGATLTFNVATGTSFGGRWDTGPNDTDGEVVSFVAPPNVSALRGIGHTSIEGWVLEVLYSFKGSQAGPHTVNIGNRTFIGFRLKYPVPIPSAVGFTFDGEIRINFDELDMTSIKVSA